MAELAARAEARGWDGFFVWDHVDYRPPVRALADPWVTLAAIAVATERVRSGRWSRRCRAAGRTSSRARRPRSTGSSGGRLVLGVGLGSERTGEFAPERFGEEADPRARAALLDDGLERLPAYWDGEFEPRAGARPRSRSGSPRAGRTGGRCAGRRATTACSRSTCPAPRRSPSSRPRSRAARATATTTWSRTRPGTDPAPWIAAGATWCLTGFGPQPSPAAVRAAIRARPPAAGPRP